MAKRSDQSALKLFISYSRQDAVAADALVADLEAQGFEVTIDRRDLPFGEEWQGELRGFIQDADTIVWLVSPTSVGSRWVNWELGEVQRSGKRLMPVVIEAVTPEDLPEALGKLHLLPAEGAFERDVHLDMLAEALRTDRAWIKEHSRLGDRAREWIAKGKGRDRLLRGAALSAAEEWRAAQSKDAPAPSPEILNLLAASERAAKRRQREWITGSLVVTFCALALAGFALLQRQAAITQRSAAGGALRSGALG